MGDTNVFEV